MFPSISRFIDKHIKITDIKYYVTLLYINLVVGFSAILTVIPVRYRPKNAHLCGITAGVIFLVCFFVVH